MTTKIFRGLTAAVMFLLFCAFFSDPPEDMVIIKTKYGDITVRLYEKTPLHRENFMKLVREHYFDSTLFHRVIQNFMIQGGDPDSKHAAQGALLGDGGPPYTIPFEYVPEYIHKKGVLAAGRESDDVNPEKASSASQFYLVQGKVFDDKGLDAVEIKVERRAKRYILMRLLKENDTLLLSKYNRSLAAKDTLVQKEIMDQWKPQIEAGYNKTIPFRLNETQRQVYKTVGGTPHLDGAYTIFGEVISGLDVIDKIAAVKTDSNDRPLEDIPMVVKEIK